MYTHDIDPSLLINDTADLLDDVHIVVTVDLVIVPLIFLFAGVTNIGLLVIESSHWRKAHTFSLPRLLIVWLACVDVIGAFVGLLPRLLVSSVQPCPRGTFVTVQMMSIFVQGFSILMSKFTVVLMGVERCASILAPYFYVRACTTYRFNITQMAFASYSVVFVSIAAFFNFTQYDDTYFYYADLDHENCHENFLIFEFGSVNHEIEFPWRYSEIGGMFQFYQLLQDMLFILVVVLCNSAVLHGLKRMNKRLLKICPRPAVEVVKKSRHEFTPPGQEFSRLMTTINIVVILLTTPQMVRNLCNYLHVAPSYLADFICQRVAVCSACVNPVIYGLLRHKVRRRITRVILRICSLDRSTPVFPQQPSSEGIETIKTTAVNNKVTNK